MDTLRKINEKKEIKKGKKKKKKQGSGARVVGTVEFVVFFLASNFSASGIFFSHVDLCCDFQQCDVGQKSPRRKETNRVAKFSKTRWCDIPSIQDAFM